MKFSRVVGGGFGFGVVVLAVWLVVRGDWQTTTTQVAESTLEDALAVPDTPDDQATRTSTLQLSSALIDAPLPPVDAPLADTFDELMARADRGDPRAACRLAIELQDCQHELPRLKASALAATAQTPVTPQMVADGDSQIAEARLNHAQMQLDAHDALKAHCRDVPEVPMDRRLGWWRQSVLAGHRAPLQEFLSGEALPVHEWVRHSDHLAGLRYQLEPLAWRAMHAGDLETAWHLLNALMPHPDFMRMDVLSQVVDVDAEAALSLAVYLEHATAHAGGDAAGIEGIRRWAASAAMQAEAALSPEQQRQARATGRDWGRKITPLPITSSPFMRYRAGPEARQWRGDRMEMCAESTDARTQRG